MVEPLPGSNALAAVRLAPSQAPSVPLKVCVAPNWWPISWAT